MSIATIARTARLYMRAEMLAAQIRLRTEAHRLMLVGLAVVLVALGVGLINLAVYGALKSVWGPVWTPLALGAGDLMLAIIALTAAALKKPGPELQVAEEMRELAGAALEEQMQGGLTPAGLLGGLAGGDTSTARLLVPMITTIIGALRKRKETKK